jgi:hypothetical protein
MRTNHTDISNVFNIAGHLMRSKILTPLCNTYGTIVIYNGLKRIGWHYVQNLVTYLNSVYNHLYTNCKLLMGFHRKTCYQCRSVRHRICKAIGKTRRRVFHCETQTARTNSHVS